MFFYQVFRKKAEKHGLFGSDPLFSRFWLPIQACLSLRYSGGRQQEARFSLQKKVPRGPPRCKIQHNFCVNKRFAFSSPVILCLYLIHAIQDNHLLIEWQDDLQAHSSALTSTTNIRQNTTSCAACALKSNKTGAPGCCA